MNFPKFKTPKDIFGAGENPFARKIAAGVILLILLLVFVVLLLSKQTGDYDNQAAIVMAIESMKTSEYSPNSIVTTGRNRPTNRFKSPYDNANNLPRIAVIVKGLGLQDDNTKKAITELPAEITMALSPYGANNPSWIDQAIENKHEILIGIPMEPADYPDTDPGPLTLLRRDTWEDNLKHLNTIAMPYDRPVGYINEFGNAYLSGDVQNRRFIDWIQLEEAIFVEDLIDNLNPPMNELSKQISADYVSSDLQIDALANTNAIVARLRKLERDAKEKGYAVGIAQPYPLTIEVIKQWAKDLDSRGVVLSPVSAVVEKRKLQ